MNTEEFYQEMEDQLQYDLTSDLLPYDDATYNSVELDYTTQWNYH